MTAQDITFPIEQGADWAFAFAYGTSTPFAPWSIGLTTSVNDVFCPTAQNVPPTKSANGLYYRTTIPGVLGTSQPVWPVIPGQTVVSGTATLICQTSSTIPVNLTGATFLCQLRTTRRARKVFLTLAAGVTPSGIVNGLTTGIITLSIGNADSALMEADSYVGDLWVTPAGGSKVKAMAITLVVTHSSAR